MSKPLLKGYTVNEVAMSQRDKLEAEYSHCKDMLTEIRDLEEKAKEMRKEYQQEVVAYRIHSVNRVLEFIRFAKITHERELNNLLCHCQNKLNGNLDGTEIELVKEEEC